MTSLNFGKLEYVKSKLENEFMNMEVASKNDLHIHKDVYLKDIFAQDDPKFNFIKGSKASKKFDVLICTKEEEVLLGISITDGTPDCQGYRMPTFEFDIDQMGDWTVDMIVEWVERKLQADEKLKYKYDPKKNKKRVKRVPLQERLDSLLEDL